MTKRITVGGVPIGGGAPVSIQSMCNTKTHDVSATVDQIHRLEAAGCEIVRVAVPDMAAARAVGTIRSRIHIPLVADIHFDYKLALECAAQGIEKELRVKYGGAAAEALAESALGHAALLERFGFTDICISVKCSSVPVTIGAYRLLSARRPYPLHLGVTEAGTPDMGMVKSAMGIGGLLCLGIGDTLRVTLTADPVEEIHAAKKILLAAGLRQEGPNIIACPTCGRTNIDLIPIAREVERRLAGCTKPITVAVMGCAVNGPGEASAADVGIAGGNGEGLLFRKGEILRKVPQDKLIDALMEEIARLPVDTAS